MKRDIILAIACWTTVLGVVIGIPCLAYYYLLSHGVSKSSVIAIFGAYISFLGTLIIISNQIPVLKHLPNNINIAWKAMDKRIKYLTDIQPFNIVIEDFNVLGDIVPSAKVIKKSSKGFKELKELIEDRYYLQRQDVANISYNYITLYNHAGEVQEFGHFLKHLDGKVHKDKQREVQAEEFVRYLVKEWKEFKPAWEAGSSYPIVETAIYFDNKIVAANPDLKNILEDRKNKKLLILGLFIISFGFLVTIASHILSKA